MSFLISLAWQYLIEMMWRASPRQVQITVTIRPFSQPAVENRISPVVETIVGHGSDPAREHFCRIDREIDPAFLQGNETFGWVEADPHGIKCTYIIRSVNHYVLTLTAAGRGG
jgi:hypothetical protein